MHRPHTRLLVARVFAALMVTPVTAVVGAEPARLTLCTARAGGSYHAAGRDIAAAAEPGMLTVTVVETSGSQENIQRLASQDCDAAIVQTDAYLVDQVEHRDQPLDLTRNRHLFAEYAHLVCRRDAGVRTLGDLIAAGRRVHIMAGAAGSGSALTWNAFAYLQPGLGDAQTQPAGGEEALRRVLGGAAHCLFFVSSFNSDFARAVDARGGDLQLVPLADEPMRSATIGGAPLYEARQISGGTYPNLSDPYGVETLTVAAILITRRAWAQRHLNGASALIRAINAAAPTMRARALRR